MARADLGSAYFELFIILPKKKCMAEISLNQLAEFSKATEKGKTRIIKQQAIPNPVLIPWYQLAKARIKKSISMNWDLSPIYSGIEILSSRTNFDSQRKQIDQKVSLEALQEFVDTPKPSILNSLELEDFKPDTKILVLGNLEIKVAPDVVFRTEIDGQIYLGAFKIHICKRNMFDLKQATLVATILYKYLEQEVPKEGELVLPSLSFCYDIFANRIVPGSEDPSLVLSNIDIWGQEINQIWDNLRQAG